VNPDPGAPVARRGQPSLTRKKPNAVSTLTVSDVKTIYDLHLTLNVSNTLNQDLTVILRGPDGTSVTLVANADINGRVTCETPGFNSKLLAGLVVTRGGLIEQLVGVGFAGCHRCPSHTLYPVIHSPKVTASGRESCLTGTWSASVACGSAVEWERCVGRRRSDSIGMHDGNGARCPIVPRSGGTASLAAPDRWLLLDPEASLDRALAPRPE
jgi:hypothetical protein